MILNKNKHFLTLDEVSKDKIIEFFEYCDRTNYTNFINRMVLTNLFYEPSTRTSSSFHSAAYELGINVIPINEVHYSSVTKGETLEDTIQTLACYSNVIVLRHPEKGAAKKAAKISSIPIINAGDGEGEHPTQTLLDLYTIWKNKKEIDGLTITLMGDLKNGRTIHSLIKVLRQFKVKINLISPHELRIPSEYYVGITDIESTTLTPYASDTDVLYVTRIQKERGSSGFYELTNKDFSLLKDSAIILHPFPRNKEIPTWVDQDTRAKYFEQIKNGVIVRKGLLRLILDYEQG